MSDSPWSIIRAERNALAKDLRSLHTNQWAAQSLCSEWTVHQVLGHITSTAKMTPTRFVTGYVGAGMSFHRLIDRGMRKETLGSPSETLAEFQSHIEDRTSPPGPVEAMVGEIIIHAEDIRRPLGLKHEYPHAALPRLADFFCDSNAILGGKQRMSGVKLVATDADWRCGDGPEVAGPLLSLILAVTGRRAALADLIGPGAAVLQDRR